MKLGMIAAAAALALTSTASFAQVRAPENSAVMGSAEAPARLGDGQSARIENVRTVHHRRMRRRHRTYRYEKNGPAGPGAAKAGAGSEGAPNPARSTQRHPL